MIRAGPRSEMRGAGPTQRDTPGLGFLSTSSLEGPKPANPTGELFPLFITMLRVEIFFAKPIKTTDGPNSRDYHVKWKRVTRATGIPVRGTAAGVPRIGE